MQIRFKKELKKIAIFYTLSYLGLYIIMILSSYFIGLKYYGKLAENTTNLATNSILSNDKRQMMFYLNTATLNFQAVQFADNNEVVQFKLPTSFDLEKSQPFLLQIKKSVSEENIEAARSVGSIIYYFDFTKIIFFTTGAWLFLILFSIPLFFYSRKSLEIKYQESLLINQLKFANELANQVAHDIRSPLTALNLVVHSANELPEEKRVLIRNAAQRINDIANNLLKKSKTQQLEKESTHNVQTHRLSEQTLATDQKSDIFLLSSLIDTIVSEKRIQYRDKISVQIEVDLNQSYGLFAKINHQEFQRALSNLINNAVEALPDSKGDVKISIHGSTNNVLIVIFDNGKGIPKHILEKLGEIGVSHGKDGPHSGSGLGVAHAKKTIESFGGKFEIKSRENEGTMVNITLPRSQTPKWFVEEIQLNQNLQVVSVDDDVSIHQVWNDRFKSLPISELINHFSFTSIKSFMDWFSSQTYDEKENNSNTLYLIDYEFLNESTTGLDLIENIKIAKQSILITSRYDDPQIRARCEKAGIKLIPKSMAGLVPIRQTKA